MSNTRTMLALETAAHDQFKMLSSDERGAYLRANPKSRFAETAVRVTRYGTLPDDVSLHKSGPEHGSGLVPGGSYAVRYKGSHVGHVTPKHGEFHAHDGAGKYMKSHSKMDAAATSVFKHATKKR